MEEPGIASSPATDTSPPTSSRSKEVRVILVHGTWARGLPWKTKYRAEAPRWFEKGSNMQREIEAELRRLGYEPVVEEPLLWDHDNSVFERGKAAAELAARLKEMPPVPCLVMAHSYAGNVVLRALEDLPNEQVFRIRVVTLATPFVEVFLPLDGLLNYERLQLGALLALVGFGLASAVQFSLAPGAMENLPMFLVGLLLLVLGLYVCFGLVRAERDCIRDKRPCLARNIYQDAAYPKFKYRPSHLLVLRGVEDEAALIISAAAMLGRVAQFLRDMLLRAWHEKFRAAIAAGVVLALSVAAIVTYSKLHGVGTDTAPDPDFIAFVRLVGIISSGIIVGLPLAMAAVAVISRSLAGSAAGRELALMPHLEVSVATAPDVCAAHATYYGRAVRFETFPRRGLQTRHIRHGIYDDPLVVQLAIRPWLEIVFPSRYPQEPRSVPFPVR